MIGWAIEALAASAALMLAVLVVRRPARRAFGPELSYALWAIPVLRLMLPPLPDAWRLSALPTLPAPEPVVIYLGRPVATFSAIATDGGVGWVEGLLAMWVAGAAAFLVWQVVGYFRFRHRVLRNGVAVDQVRSIAIVESVAASGPLAFGVIDRVVVLPCDFAARYDADERALAMAHELGHHARGDLVANWFALAVLALHWFNPLAWYAFRAFRADQEMANDARVLTGRSAAERHAYACAVVKSANGGAISAACHLHTADDLKGRLKMLATHRIPRHRLLAGSAAVGLLTLAGLGLTASGTQAAQTVRTRMEKATGIDLAGIATPASQQVATPPRTRSVVIVENGKTMRFEGPDAEAYIAAHPVPIPPIPPVPPIPAVADIPPVPPVPPAPAFAMDEGHRAFVRSEDCDPEDGQPTVMHQEDGHRVTIICTNRIVRMANAAAATATRSEDVARLAEASARTGLRNALAGLRSARAGIARNAHMPREGRAEALAAIDESIAEMEENIAQAR